MLELRDLTVSYGAITALHGVSLRVEAGSIVTLIGGNGAGKTTTLRAVSGMVKPVSGKVLFEGQEIGGIPPHRLVARGLAHCPEGRMVFANLTVRENLQMGAYLQRDQAVVRREEEYVFALFPRLQERESQPAGTLSGGEQQMLAIGRALMSQPRFLLLDEPSLGIAPLLVKLIFEKIVELNRQRGLTILRNNGAAPAGVSRALAGFTQRQSGESLAGCESSALIAPWVIGKRFIMRKFVLAALVALSGAGAAGAADFSTKVTKEFWDDSISWNGGIGKAYEFKWSVMDNKGQLIICGVGKFLDPTSRMQTRDLLRKATVSINGKPVMKDISFFATEKKSVDLATSQATCRSMGMATPRGEYDIGLDVSGSARF